MKAILILISYLVILHAQHVSSQGQRPNTCTGSMIRFPPPSKGRCFSWDQRGEEKSYPDDFEGILNQVQIYQCPSRGKRVLVSNGIPDHSVTMQNRNGPCEFNWVVELPLNPTTDNDQKRTEVPIRGMIAMAINGVPAYGPQENDYYNAVEGTVGVQGARYWYGHAAANNAWHFHNPKMGKEVETQETLLGYAMDGFPIYGHLDDDAVQNLDACNGIFTKDGKYQYHVRTLEQVDDSLGYCNGNNSETNWNYILGCYSGSVDETGIHDSTTYSLDGDCFMEGGDESVGSGSDTASTTEATRPNIIIMQPDDMPFYAEWDAPQLAPSNSAGRKRMPSAGLPHIESLRLNGVQMMQAYAASPMCGTSRYSTITSRYPSRALSNDSDESPNDVIIRTTKLEGEDCTKNNIAAELRGNGYRTAMIGKWHLSFIAQPTYTYDNAVDTVKDCGFDTVDGLYIENLTDDEDDFNNYSDGTFSHNLEWLTEAAVKVIEDESDKPFFMYFNPTVPHGSASIRSALTDYSCRDTASGTLEEEPIIPGMTADVGCAAYRQTIFDRAEEDEDLGPIWVDDAVGAMLKSLKDTGKLENTIFLFQEDHGMDPKSSLYEGGLRIPQIIQYPAEIQAGTAVDAPVSTIDVGATMLDFAGISPSYALDGKSWKSVVGFNEIDLDLRKRCLFFEHEEDRAVRCGCHKYLALFDNDSTTWRRGNRFQLSNDDFNLFDLCDGSEAVKLIESHPNIASTFDELLGCHVERVEDESFSASCELPSSAPVSAETSESQLCAMSQYSVVALVAIAYICLV